MKRNKLTFLKPKEGNSIGQWFIEQGISAGFPSPADDFKEIRISLDKELVKNKDSTFYARVSGNSMENAGLEDGDLIVIDRITGNIIKVTDIFDNFNPKKRDKILPTGFIVGLKNIYLSTNIGKLLVIDIKSGKTISTLKIDNDKISRPVYLDDNLYLVKDNAIIKLN